MPKKNHRLSPEQLRYMENAMAALNAYSQYIAANDIYSRANVQYDLPHALNEHLRAAEDMESSAQYDEWIREQENISKKIKEIITAVRAGIEQEYRSTIGKNDQRPMEEVLTSINDKDKKQEPLTPIEDNLLAAATDYETLSEFRKETEKFEAALAPAAEVKAEGPAGPQAQAAGLQAGPYSAQNDARAALSQAAAQLNDLTQELKDLESHGHHYQWKAMKEALKQAKNLADHMPEDPAMAQRKMAAAMNVLMQTSMNYAAYKAGTNPTGKNLSRQQLAEKISRFAATLRVRTEAAVEETDAEDYVKKEDFVINLRAADAAEADHKQEYALNRQNAVLKDIYHELQNADRSSAEKNAAYKTMKDELKAFSDVLESNRSIIKTGIHHNDRDPWEKRSEDMARLIASVNRCDEQLSRSHEYSAAAIRRLNAVLQLKSYLTHLKAVELTALSEKGLENRQALKAEIAECRKKLITRPLNVIDSSKNTSNFYSIYAARLYEKALANGGKTPEEKEIISSVEEAGRYTSEAEGSYARKLLDADRENPDTVTAKWFLGHRLKKYQEKQLVEAMRDEKQSAEIFDAIASGRNPEDWFAEKEAKMNPEELAVLKFRSDIEDKRQDMFYDLSRDLKGEKFKPEENNIGKRCYYFAVADLFESAAAREAKGLADEKDKEILTAVKSGKGLEYAESLMKHDKEDVNSVMYDWFEPKSVTYETAKAMTSSETAAPILDKISKGISPELSEEKRAANIQHFLDRTDQVYMSFKTYLLELTPGAKKLSDIKEEDFRNKAGIISDKCYDIYIGARYRKAAKLVKEGGKISNEDRDLIKAVESGKEIRYILRLEKDDEKNPNKTTAQWFGKGKITLRTASDMTADSDRLDAVLDAIGEGRSPSDEHRKHVLNELRSTTDSSIKAVRETAQYKQQITKSVCKDCYNIYIAYLYEKAVKNGGNTPQEKEIIQAVESGSFDAHQKGTLGDRMFTDDRTSLNSVTSAWFTEGKLNYEILQALSDKDRHLIICEAIAAGKKPEEAVLSDVPVRSREENIKAFRDAVDDSRDFLRSQFIEGNAFDEEQFEALKGDPKKDPGLKNAYVSINNSIFYVYADALYRSLPEKNRTPEQQHIADLVESGRSQELVNSLMKDTSLRDSLDIANIVNDRFDKKKVYLKQSLKEGGFDQLVKPLTVRSRLSAARKDPELVTARTKNPTAEKAPKLSDLAFTIYAALRYQEAKKLKEPTAKSRDIIELVEKDGLDAYIKVLKKEDKAIGQLFDPKNLTSQTIDKLFTFEGRQEFTNDINDAIVNKADGKNKVEKSNDAPKIGGK